MSGNRWFRFYAEAINDPKVQRLSPSLFRTWVNCLCLACTHPKGHLPSIDDIAFKLRLSVNDAMQHVDDLIMAGLIDINPDGSRSPHNWETRQFVSDTSTERVRKHRKLKAETPFETTCNVSETPPDTETDTDTERKLVPSTEQEPARDVPDREQLLNDIRTGKVKAKASRKEPIEYLRARAEGFGIDVAEVWRVTEKAKPSNVYGYFFGVCLKRLLRVLPNFADDVLRAALKGDPGATRLVFAALTDAGGIA